MGPLPRVINSKCVSQSLDKRAEDLEEKLDQARKGEVQLRAQVARYERRLKARESVQQK